MQRASTAKQPMNTNLNAVIRTNPKNFYPKHVASINFRSTTYDPITFEQTKNPTALVQKKSGSKIFSYTVHNSHRK